MYVYYSINIGRSSRSEEDAKKNQVVVRRRKEIFTVMVTEESMIT